MLACAQADAAPSRDDFARTVREIQVAFNESRFSDIEALHTASARQVTDDGTPMLEAFEYAYDSLFGHAPLARLEAGLASWSSAARGSSIQAVTEAFLWERRALKAHGAWCQPLDAAGKPLAARFLERAKRALERADPAATPLWFTASLRVAGARGDSPQALDRLLARAASMHPGYPAIYWARGAFFLPPWSEGPQAFERFATEHAARGSGGASIGYAMLYVAVARETCGDFLESTQVSWRKMRAGLEELAVRHPSDWNWNLLGTFACRFRDVDATRTVLARLGRRARLDIWSSGQSTQSCRVMATDPKPEKDRSA